MLAASPEGDLLPYSPQTIHPVPLSRERLSSKQTLQERARALEHRPRLARGPAGVCLVEKGGSGLNVTKRTKGPPQPPRPKSTFAALSRPPETRFTPSVSPSPTGPAHAFPRQAAKRGPLGPPHVITPGSRRATPPLFVAKPARPPGVALAFAVDGVSAGRSILCLRETRNNRRQQGRRQRWAGSRASPMTWRNARARADPFALKPFAGTGVTVPVASGCF
jgi:hypothetical protein